MPNLIGVRVHFNDARESVLHDDGRKFYAADDGILRVTDEAVRDVAVHAAMEWAWAELVHAEPEPFAGPITIHPVAPNITWTSNVSMAPSEPTPAERIAAAEKAIEDAHAAQARAMQEHVQAIADAQRALADLRAELGDAA